MSEKKEESFDFNEVIEVKEELLHEWFDEVEKIHDKVDSIKELIKTLSQDYTESQKKVFTRGYILGRILAKYETRRKHKMFEEKFIPFLEQLAKDRGFEVESVSKDEIISTIQKETKTVSDKLEKMKEIRKKFVALQEELDALDK